MKRGWNSEEILDVDQLDEDSWAKGFFSSSHTNWDGRTWKRNFHELRQRDLTLFSLGNLKGKKVLDIGCGSAEYLTVIGKMGTQFVGGQDLGEEQIKNGRKRLEREGIEGKLIIGNAIKLEFPDNFFDCAVSNDFFEHITYEEKQKVICEVFRVLKPGGIFTIKTPNISYLKLVILLKRMFNLFRFKSPFIYIAHTKDNPTNEHHGLTTFKELEKLLIDNFFHTPSVTYAPLIRKRLPKTISRLLFGKKIFTETIILSSRKALFYGFYK